MAASTPPATLSDFYNSLEPRLRRVVPPTGVLILYLRWACSQWPVTPPQMHYVAIMVVLAHEMVRRGLVVRPAARFKAPALDIRACFIADSAAGKSSAIRAAKTFHGDLRDRSFGKYRADGSLIPDPWLNLSGSEQGLEMALAEHFDRELGITPIIGHHEELTKLLHGTGRGGYGASEDWYNMFFDGIPAKDRIENTKSARAAAKDAGRIADNPVSQAIFSSTPAAMRRAVTEVHREGGLLSRIGLYVGGKGNSLPLPFSELSDDEVLEMTAGPLYDEAFTAFDSVGSFLLSPDTTKIIGFDRPAQKVLNAFVVEVSDMPRDSEMGAARVRSTGLVMTIAAVIAMSRICDPDRRDVVRDQVLVRKDDAERAIELVRWSWETQEALYDATTSVTQAGSISVPTMRFQDRVIAVIEEAGEEGISLTDLRRRVERWAGFNSLVFKTLIADLTDAETSPVEVERIRGTGRPTTRLYKRKLSTT